MGATVEPINCVLVLRDPRIGVEMGVSVDFRDRSWEEFDWVAVRVEFVCCRGIGGWVRVLVG